MPDRILLCAAACALTPSLASADLIELTVRGESLTGSAFEFVVVYESQTPHNDPVSETSRFYDALISARAWVDDELLIEFASPEDFGVFRSISVHDDSTLVPTGQLFDGFFIVASQNTAVDPGIVGIQLRDFDAAAHNGMTLPTSLDLNDYEDRIFDLLPPGGSNMRFEITFLETRIVPAPAGTLVVAGALVLAKRRRR